jgi:hypothetical protein
MSIDDFLMYEEMKSAAAAVASEAEQYVAH